MHESRAMPRVRFRPGGRSVEVSKGTLLIDAVREAGLPIASPCGDDLICGRCGVRLLSGRVTREAPIERNAKQRNRVDPELRLACALRVHDDLEVTADYWGPL
jgi:2Fe-2S ferredoxin